MTNNTDKPDDYGTVREAIRLLREPLPDNFTFDFGNVLYATSVTDDGHWCGTAGCAMGVLWLRDGREPRGLGEHEVEDFLSERFACKNEHFKVFWGYELRDWRKALGQDTDQLITATDIADILEAIEDGQTLDE